MLAVWGGRRVVSSAVTGTMKRGLGGVDLGDEGGVPCVHESVGPAFSVLISFGFQ